MVLRTMGVTTVTLHFDDSSFQRKGVNEARVLESEIRVDPTRWFRTGGCCNNQVRVLEFHVGGELTCAKDLNSDPFGAMRTGTSSGMPISSSSGSGRSVANALKDCVCEASIPKRGALQ